MAAGSITVDLLAKTGSFETDIERATKKAKKDFQALSKGIKDSFAGNLLADLTQDLVSSLAGMPRAIIDGIDALNDMSDATGASIENLSALEDVAERTGTSFDTVGAALVKFNAQLKDANDKNDAGAVFKNLGLDLQALKAMDPAEALRVTARALDGFADSGEKARYVQVLFGKSVRETAPFLKDLAEQSALVAKVTTEEAKAAEAFNKEIFGLQKSIKDLARMLLGDLVTSINEAARAWRESGLIEGFRTLVTGTDLHKANVQISELTGQLLDAENKLLAARRAGFLVDMHETRVAQLKKELKLAQDYKKLLTEPFFAAPPGPPKPEVKPLPTDTGGPKKDPDADYKARLAQLEQMSQKTRELTELEKLRDDIRRGAITLTKGQQQELETLIARNDAERDALEIAKARQQQRNKDNEDALAAARKIEEDQRARVETLTSAGPGAQLERQRKDLQFLADLVEQGKLAPEVFADAATGMLGLADAVAETKSLSEELGMTFASAFEDAAINGADLSDVFKGLLQDLARLILRLHVIEPLLEMFKENTKGMSTPQSGAGIGGAVVDFAKTAIASYFGGAMAGGGDVAEGRQYLVGEHGPEMFVPRTAGAIAPNAAGTSGGNISVINQTTGRIDRVVTQRVSATDRALILQENRAAILGELYDPGSKYSRGMQANFDVKRKR